jgi:hypothetical protein
MPHPAPSHTAENRTQNDADTDQNDQNSQTDGYRRSKGVELQLGDQYEDTAQQADGPKPGEGGADEEVDRGNQQKQGTPTGKEQGKAVPRKSVQMVAQIPDAYGYDAKTEEKLGQILADSLPSRGYTKSHDIVSFLLRQILQPLGGLVGGDAMFREHAENILAGAGCVGIGTAAALAR